jgi:hypothetical protein
MTLLYVMVGAGIFYFDYNYFLICFFIKVIAISMSARTFPFVRTTEARFEKGRTIWDDR